MITKEHQDLLRKAVATNEGEKINSAFQKVLKEEFRAIQGLNPVAQEYLCELAKLIVVPFKIEVSISQDEDSVAPQKSGEGLKSMMASLIALVGVSVIADEYGKLWGISISIVLAVLAFFVAKKSAAKKVSNEIIQPKFSMVKTYDVNALIELVENLVKEIKGLVSELVDLNTDNSPVAIKLPLHENYPIILKWLQMVYADAVDFDVDAKTYLLKRIVKIAHYIYYDVVVYDGNNENLFEKETDSELDSVKMYSPAIIYNKTGKVVLPGKIFVPSK